MVRVGLAVLVAAISIVSVCAPKPEEPALALPAVCAPARNDLALVFVKRVTNDYAVIRFEGPIREPGVNLFLAMLEDAPRTSFKYLMLEFSTSGGAVTEGWRMARAMEKSPLPVYCVVDTGAESMGFYVLQACSQRLMLRTAKLLAHEPSKASFLPMNRFALRELEVELAALAEEMITFESHRLLITRAEFAHHIDGPSKDWVLDADEALKVGAVDELFDTLGEATTRPVLRGPARGAPQ